MRKIIYPMMVSLDGFIEGPNQNLSWHVVDEELHRYFNDRESTIDAHLYGRKVYEIMVAFWPNADEDTTMPDYIKEYSLIWKKKTKIVFSKTLDKVDWNARLVKNNIAEEVMKLKEEPGNTLTVGGAGIASTFMRLGLIDECHMYMNPVLVGAGTPIFQDVEHIQKLRLIDTRTFSSGVVFLRYELKK